MSISDHDMVTNQIYSDIIINDWINDTISTVTQNYTNWNLDMVM